MNDTSSRLEAGELNRRPADLDDICALIRAHNLPVDYCCAVEYDVVDLPLLRAEYYRVDAYGRILVDLDTDRPETFTVERLLGAPLPSWWTPEPPPDAAPVRRW